MSAALALFGEDLTVPNMGLPEETKEESEIFGDYIVSIQREDLHTPIVTFVYQLKVAEISVYSIVTLEYDQSLFSAPRSEWLVRALQNMHKMDNGYLRDTTVEPLTAQALVYLHAEKFRERQKTKEKSHERSTNVTNHNELRELLV